MTDAPRCLVCESQDGLYAVTLWWLDSSGRPEIHELQPIHVCDDCCEEVHLLRHRSQRGWVFMQLLIVTTLFAAAMMLAYFSLGVRFDRQLGEWVGSAQNLAVGVLGLAYILTMLLSGRWLLGGRNRSRSVCAAAGLRQHFSAVVPRLVPGAAGRDFDPDKDQLTISPNGATALEQAPPGFPTS